MAVQEQLFPGEHIFAFLDDVCALSAPERTSAIYKRLEETLFATTGIRLHTGKTRTWNRAGEIPEGKMLGTPVGSEEFHFACTPERLAEEAVLWRAIPWEQDLQCAWQFLVQCAGPRCNHFVRTVPPSFSGLYAEGQATMATLLEGVHGDATQQRVQASWRHCPCEWGDWVLVQRRGLPLQHIGLHGATHFPASLPDRPLLHSGGEWRSRWLCGRFAERLCHTRSERFCRTTIVGPAVAASSLEHNHRETVVLAQSVAPDQAHLRSHLGPRERANQARVQDAARCVPYCDPGKTSSPSGHNELQVRVRWVRGQLGPSPCCMPGQSFRRGQLPECVAKQGQWFVETSSCMT